MLRSIGTQHNTVTGLGMSQMFLSIQILCDAGGEFSRRVGNPNERKGRIILKGVEK